MSESGPPELPSELRERTLAHFEEHRQAWQDNPALRACYGHWYRRMRQMLPAPELGPWIEIGSGPGFAREFIPELELTDVVQAPWHSRRMSAESLPVESASLGAIVLFDVLHHIAEPAKFFTEATRALKLGGRIVLCEPFISPLSHWVYRRFHPEPVDMSVDPLIAATSSMAARDPFASNQGIPSLLFFRRQGKQAFARAFPKLEIVRRERFAGPAYPASGGFSRGPLLPMALWRILFAIENGFPEFAFAVFGFRALVVLERRP
jgi:SAM-dependent methyltransferase